MKEFHVKIEEQLQRGLRKYHGEARNKYELFDLLNLRSTPTGIRPYNEIAFPIPDAQLDSYGLTDEAFPFPQLFIGKKNIFILGVDRIFYVDPSDWSVLYQLDTYDAENVDTLKSIVVGNAWSSMDFWDTTLFTNGVCTIIISGVDTITGGTGKVYVFDRTPIQCIADHKGRGLFGGFDYRTFWGATWETFWKEWYDKNTDVGLHPYQTREGANKLMPVDENWIWWSSIGGGDLLFLFFPSLFTGQGFLTSEYGSTQPFIMDILEKNEQGFAPMPFPGKLLSMQSLRKSVIVYGEKGIARITPVVSPSPTYAVESLNSGGLASRGAVAGDSDKQVFLDNSGMLYLIADSGEITALGYKEYFYGMLENDVQISYSPEASSNNKLGRFFISGGGRNFCLDSNGLSETKRAVTSAFYFQGGTIGLGDQLVNVEDVIGTFGIDTFDLGLSGLKTIEWVRLAGVETIWNESNGIQLQVSLDYRNRIGHDLRWNSTGYKKVNKEGVVYFPISGLEFRLNVKVTDYKKLEVSYIEVGFKHTDKRYKRSLPISYITS